MSFIRSFSKTQINNMTGEENAELFTKLKADVLKGEVFPAVRKDELHFYYRGGCLYRFSGNSFQRDKNYEKFGAGLTESDPYERAKREIEIKFTNAKGKQTERRLLDSLNRHAFAKSYNGSVVVLDIEVNLNGDIGGRKKCDLVLLNRATNELMFVEGKVFSDRRVCVALSFTPEVIGQVNTYTTSIAAQREVILAQYARHIEIVNELFDSSLRPPQKLVTPAKLLVYETPLRPTKNGEYSINKINAELGADNVLWNAVGNSPSLDEIWEKLTS